MVAKRKKFEKNGNLYHVIDLKENEDDKYGFSFGLRKAQLILKHVEEIKQFVDDRTDSTDEEEEEETSDSEITF